MKFSNKLKYKKERKKAFETKNWVKMCHIQRKTVSIFDYFTCLFRLSHPLSEKIRNRQTPPPPLVRKNQKSADSPLGG